MTANLSQNLTLLDAATLVLYLVLIAGVGLYFSRNQNAESFFLGHRRLPAWVVGLAMFASILSAFTFIAFPGMAYNENWAVLLRDFQLLTVLLLCGWWIIPVYRRVIRMSVFEYLEKRVGAFMRLWTSAGTIFVAPIGTGVILYVFALALTSMTGWDIRLVILVVSGVTFLYTFSGGIEAVVWTEVLQAVLFMGAGLLCAVYLLFWAAPDGPWSLLVPAWEAGKMGLGSWEPSVSRETAWVFILVGLVSAITKFTRDQAVVQRYLLAANARSAFTATLISTLCCMATWFLFTLIGTLLWAYYQAFPERLPAGDLKGDQIFPFFIASELPSGLTGLVLAGLCASAMAGLAAGLNGVGSLVVSDFYLRFSKKPCERRQLAISRAVVAVLGLVTVAIAWGLTFWEGSVMRFVLDVLGQAFALFIGGATGVFLLALLSRRASPRGIYLSFAASIVFSIWAILTGNPAISDWLGARLTWWSAVPSYDGHIWLIMLWGDLLIMVLGYALSFIVSPGYMAPKNLTVWGWRADSLPAPDTKPQ